MSFWLSERAGVLLTHQKNYKTAYSTLFGYGVYIAAVAGNLLLPQLLQQQQLPRQQQDN
jgi:hypothetical protein